MQDKQAVYMQTRLRVGKGSIACRCRVIKTTDLMMALLALAARLNGLINAATSGR